MTDREMLLMAYGAMQAVSNEGDNLAYIVTLVQEHLYPPIPETDEIEMGQPIVKDVVFKESK